MIFLKALTGSRLHDLYNENSDFDWKLINVSPLRRVLSPFTIIKGKDSVSPEEDNCTYEFTHFCKLFAESNPTILEILWSTHFEEKHPLAQELIDGRRKMLRKEKIFYSHRGYAHDQRKKMSLDQPNEHRSAKAIVAYFRIINQGISLLKTGDFNPVIPEGGYRDFLLDIKYGFEPQRHIPIVLKELETVELELQAAFDNCELSFEPDLPWLEEMIEKIYLELGNDQSSNSRTQQQVSRCSD